MVDTKPGRLSRARGARLADARSYGIPQAVAASIATVRYHVVGGGTDGLWTRGDERRREAPQRFRHGRGMRELGFRPETVITFARLPIRAVSARSSPMPP